MKVEEMEKTIMERKAQVWTTFASRDEQENLQGKAKMSPYTKVLTHWSPYMQELVKDFMVGQMVRVGAKNVIDAGMGSATVTLELLRAGIAHVQGLDKDTNMVEEAKDRVREHAWHMASQGKLPFYGKADVSPISLRLQEVSQRVDAFVGHVVSQGDVHELPYPDASVDGVVSNNVIFFLDDPQKFLKEVARVLAPGGTFVISGPRPHPEMDVLFGHMEKEFKHNGLYEELKEDVAHFKHATSELFGSGGVQNTYEAKELISMLAKVGLTVVLESREDLYLGNSYGIVVQKPKS